LRLKVQQVFALSATGSTLFQVNVFPAAGGFAAFNVQAPNF
jgi:hypothetical protein